MTTKAILVLLLAILASSAGCVTVRCYDNDGVYGTSGSSNCTDEGATSDGVDGEE